MSHFKFGKTAIAGLPTPESGKRDTHYDTEVTKLALRVTSAGAKSFFVVKRAGREMVWLRLGAFPDMTVEQARNAALTALAAFANNENPAEVRRAQREELTFAELFKEYGERHGAKKRSWVTDQCNYAKHLQGIAPLKVTTIKREAISRLMSNMEKAGLAGATQNNVRALVSSIYGRAIEWGYVTANPVIGVKTRPKVKRDRFLQSDELPRFFQSVADEPNEAMRDFILLSLLTGARRANVLAMRWDEVNIDDGIWRIPVTKNGTPQNVTLSPEAVQVLLARRDANSKSATGFVFPGVGASGHMEEPKKGVIRIMERAGIPYGRNVENGVTLHDLRRTLGSWQAKTGASLAIIGKSLNHKSQQATMIYARLDLDPVRQSVNTATSAMMEAAGLKPVAEVVPLKKRAIT
jgi:integrase